MKTFLKSFIIAFVFFTLLIGAGVYAFMEIYNPKNPEPGDSDGIAVLPSPAPVDGKEKTELQKLIEKSKRVNVLLLGMEGPRTDTIILASFDPDSKSIDLISIPRDTFYHIEGYNEPDQKKINAAYGRSGVKGVMKIVSHILGDIPIHDYVKVSYEGVENIVDSLGGVKVNIPFDMNYDDPYDDPPLHIHLKKGVHELSGKEAIQFLRFRKNNDGTGYPDGDIGRIRAQQQFLMGAADKILSYRLPVIAHTMFKFVKTSMSLEDIIYYAKNAIGVTKNDIETYRLPGRAKYNGLSYYIHDPDATEKMIIEIYKRGLQE
jgi:LCP family protein required for cell wall assembly